MSTTEVQEKVEKVEEPKEPLFSKKKQKIIIRSVE